MSPTTHSRIPLYRSRVPPPPIPTLGGSSRLPPLAAALVAAAAGGSDLPPASRTSPPHARSVRADRNLLREEVLLKLAALERLNGSEEADDEEEEAVAVVVPTTGSGGEEDEVLASAELAATVVAPGPSFVDLGVARARGPSAGGTTVGDASGAYALSHWRHAQPSDLRRRVDVLASMAAASPAGGGGTELTASRLMALTAAIWEYHLNRTALRGTSAMAFVTGSGTTPLGRRGSTDTSLTQPDGNVGTDFTAAVYEYFAHHFGESVAALSGAGGGGGGGFGGGGGGGLGFSSGSSVAGAAYPALPPPPPARAPGVAAAPPAARRGAPLFYAFRRRPGGAPAETGYAWLARHMMGLARTPTDYNPLFAEAMLAAMRAVRRCLPDRRAPFMQALFASGPSPGARVGTPALPGGAPPGYEPARIAPITALRVVEGVMAGSAAFRQAPLQRFADFLGVPRRGWSAAGRRDMTEMLVACLAGRFDMSIILASDDAPELLMGPPPPPDAAWTTAGLVAPPVGAWHSGIQMPHFFASLPADLASTYPAAAPAADGPDGAATDEDADDADDTADAPVAVAATAPAAPAAAAAAPDAVEDGLEMEVPPMESVLRAYSEAIKGTVGVPTINANALVSVEELLVGMAVAWQREYERQARRLDRAYAARLLADRVAHEGAVHALFERALAPVFEDLEGMLEVLSPREVSADEAAAAATGTVEVELQTAAREAAGLCAHPPTLAILLAEEYRSLVVAAVGTMARVNVTAVNSLAHAADMRQEASLAGETAAAAAVAANAARLAAGAAVASAEAAARTAAEERDAARAEAAALTAALAAAEEREAAATAAATAAQRRAEAVEPLAAQLASALEQQRVLAEELVAATSRAADARRDADAAQREAPPAPLRSTKGKGAALQALRGASGSGGDTVAAAGGDAAGSDSGGGGGAAGGGASGTAAGGAAGGAGGAGGANCCVIM